MGRSRRQPPYGLTGMMAEYVRHRLERPDLPQQWAAEQAGSACPGPYASRAEKDPRVIAALADGRKEAWEGSVASGVETLNGLSRLWREGVYPDGRACDNTRERLKASELLLRHHGEIVDRVEVSGRVDVVHWNLTVFSEEELEQLHAMSLRATVSSPN